ncbi:hypothetical protein SDC9_198367 [bioreactor metagenome]|uniref:Uncharacterized protein n=1 Tax=bioreactor metagenome TaxID=1076179 RepID=A0A645IQV1_9ZZZZ
MQELPSSGSDPLGKLPQRQQAAPVLVLRVHPQPWEIVDRLLQVITQRLLVALAGGTGSVRRQRFNIPALCFIQPFV